MSPTSATQSILFASDAHSGSEMTHFPLYEKSLLDTLNNGHYRHLAFIGDWFEFFYISNTLIHPNEQEYAPAKPYARKIDIHNAALRTAIEEHIVSSIHWLDDFLTDHPRCFVHFVLGNHENMEIFREALDGLQEKHANFEWDPEAIRVGNALLTHGDLALQGKTDAEREMFHLRDAEKGDRLKRLHKLVEEPGMFLIKHAQPPEQAIQKIHEQLVKWGADAASGFHYTQNRETYPFSMEGIEHVFFGHTHLKVEDFEYEGVHYHNLGAFKKGNGKDIGILEAVIEHERIRGLKPVRLQRAA